MRAGQALARTDRLANERRAWRAREQRPLFIGAYPCKRARTHARRGERHKCLSRAKLMSKTMIPVYGSDVSVASSLSTPTKDNSKFGHIFPLHPIPTNTVVPATATHRHPQEKSEFMAALANPQQSPQTTGDNLLVSQCPGAQLFEAPREGSQSSSSPEVTAAENFGTVTTPPTNSVQPPIAPVSQQMYIAPTATNTSPQSQPAVMTELAPRPASQTSQGFMQAHNTTPPAFHAYQSSPEEGAAQYAASGNPQRCLLQQTCFPLASYNASHQGQPYGNLAIHQGPAPANITAMTDAHYMPNPAEYAASQPAYPQDAYPPVQHQDSPVMAYGPADAQYARTSRGYVHSPTSQPVVSETYGNHSASQSPQGQVPDRRSPQFFTGPYTQPPAAHSPSINNNMMVQPHSESFNNLAMFGGPSSSGSAYSNMDPNALAAYHPAMRRPDQYSAYLPQQPTQQSYSNFPFGSNGYSLDPRAQFMASPQPPYMPAASAELPARSSPSLVFPRDEMMPTPSTSSGRGRKSKLAFLLINLALGDNS